MRGVFGRERPVGNFDVVCVKNVFLDVLFVEYCCMYISHVHVCKLVLINLIGW